MKEKLPKVFEAPINKEFKNNKEVFRSGERVIVKDTINKNDINKIFSSKNHVYKTRVLIKTNNMEKEVDIVGLKNNNIITLSGDLININDIIEIKKV
jgi:hypothetical protein